MGSGSIVGGRYRLQEHLGDELVGTLFAAEDLVLRRRVAIEIGHAHQLGNAAIARHFEREALIGSRVAHRNVVAVYDAGATLSGVPYVVFEYVEGTRLGQLVAERGGLGLHRLVGIADQLLGALDAIHNVGFVVGAITSNDVVVDPERDDLVKLLVARGVASTPHADLFAAAVVIYEMLTGAPCAEEDIVPPSQRRPDLVIPVRLERAVMKALGDSTQRYATASAFAEAIAYAVRDSLPELPAPVTVTKEWSLPHRTPSYDPTSRGRLNLAKAIRSAQPDDIVTTCLELVGTFLEGHRLDDAASILEHAVSVLTKGAPIDDDSCPPALWRLVLPLAAIRDGLGDHVRARELARNARTQAARAASKLGVRRADELLARFAGRRRAGALHHAH